MRPGWQARVLGGLREHEVEREQAVIADTSDPASPGSAGPPDHPSPATGEPTPPGPKVRGAALACLAARPPGGAEPPESMAEPKAPVARVGPYTIVRELARGGAGVVYVAKDERLGRLVALKLLRSGDAASPEQLERFDVEARAAARLRHPGIVAIHEVGHDAGAPYLVMDLVVGRSLAQRLKDEGPLEPREAARIGEALARALAYAHGRFILHRDVKPGNVLLGLDNAPLLTDFGLAKEIGRPASGPTVTGQVMGTPAYMPPEQASGHMERVDVRSDVYALGATLREMLVGRPPYDGRDVMAVLAQVVAPAPVPAARALRPELDLDLDTICARCLEKEPDDRYPTALAVADDLARWLRHEPIVARPPGLAERGRKWLRRNQALARALGLTIAAALVAGAVGAGLFVRRLQVETARADRTAEEATRQAVIAREQAEVAQAATRRADAEAATARDATRRADAEAAAARKSADDARRQAAVAQESLRVLIYEVRNRLDDIPGRELARARERILRQAIDSLADLSSAALAADDRSIQAADALLQIGDLRLLSDQDGMAAAERAYREATAIMERAHEAAPDDPITRQHLVRAQMSLGEGLRAAGKLEEARAVLEEGVRHARHLVDTPHPATGDETVHITLRRDLAVALERLSRVTAEQGDARRGLELMRQALAEWRHAWRVEQHERDRVPTATALVEVGRLERECRQLDQARATLGEALTLAQQAVEWEPSAEARLHLLEAHQMLALVHEDLGEPARALEQDQLALALARALIAETPTHLLARRRAAELLGRLARNGPRAHMRARYDEAERLLRDLLATVGDASTRVALASTLEDHAARLLEDLDAVRAAALAAESIELLRAPAPADLRWYLAESLHTLARARLVVGELAAARAAEVEAVAARRALLAEGGGDVGEHEARRELAASLLVLGDAERGLEGADAAGLYEEARALLAPHVEADAKDQRCRATLVELLGRQAALARGPEASVGALDVLLSAAPVDPAQPDSVRRRLRLLQSLAQGRIGRDEGKRAEAARLLDEAEGRARDLLARREPDPELACDDRRLAAMTRALRGDLLAASGEHAGAADASRAAIELLRGVVDASAARRPGDAGAADPARRELAVALERLGDALRRTERAPDALRALEESLALRRGLLERDPAGVNARRDVTAALGGLVNVRQALDDLPGAILALSEAVENHRLLVQQAPRYERELAHLEGSLRQLRAAAGPRPAQPEGTAPAPAPTPREQLRVAYAHLQAGEALPAARAFRLALAEPRNTDDLREQNLYNGACAAALAAAAAPADAPAEERADALLALAWRWLEDDLDRFGTLLGRIDAKLADPGLPAAHKTELDGMRDFCMQHFARAREDPDLEPLRRDAARFEEAFPEAVRRR